MTVLKNEVLLPFQVKWNATPFQSWLLSGVEYAPVLHSSLHYSIKKSREKFSLFSRFTGVSLLMALPLTMPVVSVMSFWGFILYASTVLFIFDDEADPWDTTTPLSSFPWTCSQDVHSSNKYQVGSPGKSGGVWFCMKVIVAPLMLSLLCSQWKINEIGNRSGAGCWICRHICLVCSGSIRANMLKIHHRVTSRWWSCNASLASWWISCWLCAMRMIQAEEWQ